MPPSRRIINIYELSHKSKPFYLFHLSVTIASGHSSRSINGHESPFKFADHGVARDAHPSKRHPLLKCWTTSPSIPIPSYEIRFGNDRPQDVQKGEIKKKKKPGIHCQSTYPSRRPGVHADLRSCSWEETFSLESRPQLTFLSRAKGERDDGRCCVDMTSSKNTKFDQSVCATLAASESRCQCAVNNMDIYHYHITKNKVS